VQQKKKEEEERERKRKKVYSVRIKLFPKKKSRINE
jgi:hypothetical protein